MRLKTKLVLAITGLVFLVVFTLSWIFLGQLLRQRCLRRTPPTTWWRTRFSSPRERTLGHNIRDPVNPNDPKALRAAVAEALRSDPELTALLNSAIRYSPTVFDVSIADSEGRGLLSTDPTNLDHLLPHRHGIRGAGKRRVAAAAGSGLRTASRLQRDLAAGTSQSRSPSPPSGWVFARLSCVSWSNPG